MGGEQLARGGGRPVLQHPPPHGEARTSDGKPWEADTGKGHDPGPVFKEEGKRGKRRPDFTTRFLGAAAGWLGSHALRQGGALGLGWCVYRLFVFERRKVIS